MAPFLGVQLALLVVRGLVGRGGIADLVVGAASLAAAALEFVNYNPVQLGYDSRADLAYLLAHRRLERATMVRELDI